MNSVSFFVQGIAKPAGSKRGFYIKNLNRVVITDANPKSADWKTDVKHEAQRQYSGPLMLSCVQVEFVFYMPRPKGHYRTGKNASELRASAPGFPAGKPDLLKLARGVEDALTSVVWKDDAQIVTETLKKFYTSPARPPGVQITVVEFANLL